MQTTAFKMQTTMIYVFTPIYKTPVTCQCEIAVKQSLTPAIGSKIQASFLSGTAKRVSSKITVDLVGNQSAADFHRELKLTIQSHQCDC